MFSKDSKNASFESNRNHSAGQPSRVLAARGYSRRKLSLTQTFFFPEAFLSYVNLAFESGTVPIILLPSFPATVWDQRIWFWLLDAAMSLIRNHYPRLASRKKYFGDATYLSNGRHPHVFEMGKPSSQEVYTLNDSKESFEY